MGQTGDGASEGEAVHSAGCEGECEAVGSDHLGRETTEVIAKQELGVLSEPEPEPFTVSVAHHARNVGKGQEATALLRQLLKRVEVQGFYGTATLTISVENGIIQRLVENTERSHQ